VTAALKVVLHPTTQFRVHVVVDIVRDLPEDLEAADFDDDVFFLHSPVS